MITAAKTAEALITNAQKSGEVNEDSAGVEEGEEGVEDEMEDGDDTRSIGTATTNVTTTTGPGGEVVDIHSLTPQTFLVRPTRPDANRNRGKNAFKRKPKPRPTPSETQPSTGGTNTIDKVEASVKTQHVDAETGISKAELEEDEEDWFDETLVEEAEHLHLGTEEAWFLSTALGVLRIRDPKTVSRADPLSTLHLPR